MTTTSRREFLERICKIAALPAIPFASACGNDSTEVPDIDASASMCSSIGSTIANNHGHSIVVSVADVESGRAKTFVLSSNGGHAHALDLTAAELMTIANGGSVTVESSVDASHSHSVTVRCVLRDAGQSDAATDASDASSSDAGDSGATDSGSDDSGPGDAGDGGVSCTMVDAQISGNHVPPHLVVVPAADVAAGVDQMYTLTTALSHTHMITVTSAMFAMLAQGATVMVTSSTDSSHSHGVMLVCG